MANLLTRRTSSPLAGRLEPFTSLNNMLAWDPFQDLMRLDPYLGARGQLATRGQEWLPAMEVKETPTTFEFKVDVPGMKEEDLDVTLSGNRMSISGKREAETKEETDTYLTYERNFGSFNRTFSLPDEIDADKVNAELKNGVLCVTIPKIPEARAKKIEIAGK